MFLAVLPSFPHFLVREFLYSLWELLLFHLVRLTITESVSTKKLMMKSQLHWEYPTSHRFSPEVGMTHVRSMSFFRKYYGCREEWRQLFLFLRVKSTKKTLFPWSCPMLSLMPFGESLLEYNLLEILWFKFLGSNLIKMRRKTMLEKQNMLTRVYFQRIWAFSFSWE